jgi:hypothetical protein
MKRTLKDNWYKCILICMDMYKLRKYIMGDVDIHFIEILYFTSNLN